MLLAGDIGGTKTLLGLFSANNVRPSPITMAEFVTLEYDALETIVRRFLERHGIPSGRLRAASIGVAGAITDQVGRLTNVPWQVSRESLSTALGVPRVQLLND